MPPFRLSSRKNTSESSSDGCQSQSHAKRIIVSPRRRTMLIDAHAHPDKYEDLLESALTEIREQRIVTVAVSMDPVSYERNLEIGQTCELVLPTFGIHPKRAPEYAHRLSELGPRLERTPMIGEIGL